MNTIHLNNEQWMEQVGARDDYLLEMWLTGQWVPGDPGPKGKRPKIPDHILSKLMPEIRAEEQERELS